MLDQALNGTEFNALVTYHTDFKFNSSQILILFKRKDRIIPF